jgi:hypothetical protein
MSENRFDHYIRDVACDRPRPATTVAPPLPEFDDATLSLHTILDLLFPPDGRALITRNGLDAALDILFAHPQIAPLLLTLDPADVEARILSTAHPRYAAFWTHIVRPAWNQHADIQRLAPAAAGSPLPPEMC